jgi:NAD(P)-dependent dehydrogenase (short-subunit alcohol dehydrogenase family)
MFAAEGAKVVVTGRTRDLGRAVETEIRALGGEAIYVPTDVGHEEEVMAAVDAASGRYGSLTTLVNNAAPTDLMMNSVDGAIADLTTDAWEQIIRLTLTSAFWATKYALVEMLGREEGSIINISSAAAMSGAVGIDAYTAAKGGMISLTRSVAVEYGPRGIRSNCLVLGFVPGDNAPMAADPALSAAFHGAQLVSRFGHPRDVAYAATWLASDEASFVTGVVLPIDGGMIAKSNIPDLRAHFERFS